MRIGVLDARSNTVQLAIVDGQAGGPPLPVVALKQRLRLAEHIGPDGAIDAAGLYRISMHRTVALPECRVGASQR